MTGSKLLIVEDDAGIRELVCLYLKAKGYEPITAENGHRALSLFQSEKPALVVMDVLLPDMSGLQLCRTIREESDVPVLFMSCRRESEDIVNGLGSGGDDYITKPFDPAVLVARVEAQLRRYSMPRNGEDSPQVWKDGYLEIDPLSCEVRIQGKEVPLFAKERQLLLFLFHHPNRIFSTVQLYNEIWGWDSTTDERTVMVHIHHLRKKIEEEPARPKYILTVRGFGYKFAEVAGR
ncbi:response regulator transcription factor [Paenibacillus sp. CC-CFT747]|nr:response regulator transcription factor [Paenibacillus sp. CC-CFT747]